MILVPIKIRPDVDTALAASRADETRLKVGQPDVIRPGIGAGRDVMRAVIVAAIVSTPRTPDSRISPNVIFSGHDLCVHLAIDSGTVTIDFVFLKDLPRNI